MRECPQSIEPFLEDLQFDKGHSLVCAFVVGPGQLTQVSQVYSVCNSLLIMTASPKLAMAERLLSIRSSYGKL